MSSNGPEGSSSKQQPPGDQSDPQYGRRPPHQGWQGPTGTAIDESQPPPQGLMSPPSVSHYGATHLSQQQQQPPHAYGMPGGPGPSGYWPQIPPQQQQHSPSRYPPGAMGVQGSMQGPMPGHPGYPGGYPGSHLMPGPSQYSMQAMHGYPPLPPPPGSQQQPGADWQKSNGSMGQPPPAQQQQQHTPQTQGRDGQHGYPQMDSNASTSTQQQQQHQQQQQVGPQGGPLQSPNSSSHEESAAENHQEKAGGFHSPPFPHTPTSHHRQMHAQPQNPQMLPPLPQQMAAGGAYGPPPPQPMQPQQQQPQPQQLPAPSGNPDLKAAQREAVDKLVAGIESPQRRFFFEKLVLLNEKHGETLSAAPQVSKTPVDLYNLYFACMHLGGFEQVTKDKAWKNLCPKANPTMQESSAAGYQLRRHYQKYLLTLECQETGQNAEELVAFADKMKKKKKEKEPQGPGGTPSTSGGAGGKQPQQQQGGGGAHPAPGMQPNFGTPAGGSGGLPPPPPPAGGDPFGQPNPYYYQQAPHPAWAAQHGYPPQYPGAYPSHPGMRAPGMRPPPPMGELTEEQQRQQQYYHHQQQQQAYAAHMQQQQAMAAAQHQHQIQQQQQAQHHPPTSSSSSLQLPEASRDRASTSTTPVPPASNATVAACGSRASSVGPPPQTNTPDSSSRMSANNEEGGGSASQARADQQPRPPSQQPPSNATRHTPTPTYSSYAANANAPTPPLTTSVPPMMGQPPPSGPPYYAGPMAPYGMRPPTAHQMPGGKLPYGVLAGYPTASSAGEMYPSHLGYPPPQPGMWMPPQHGQRYPPPTNSEPFPSAQLKGQPAPVQMQQQPPHADPQRRAAQPPQGVYYPPAGASGMSASGPGGPMPGAHSPGSAHRNRYPNMPSTSSGPQLLSSRAPFPPHAPGGYGLSQHSHALSTLPPHMTSAPSTSSMPIPGPTYPPGSVEATTSNTATLKRKRPKVYTRDLTMVTPKRILMALRSGLTMETIWAINVLNVVLYDDTVPPFNTELVPDLLSVIIEHLLSVLSLLFPDYFKVRECKWTLNATESTENTPPNCVGSLLGELLHTHVKEIKESVKAAVKPPIGRQSFTKLNFSRISRTGRPVKDEPKDLPNTLKKMGPAGMAIDALQSEDDALKKPKSGQVYIGLAERVRHNLVVTAKSQWELKRPVFNKCLVGKEPGEWLRQHESDCQEGAAKVEESVKDEELLFYRCAKPNEQWDRFATPNCSLIPRTTSLYEQDEALVELVNRCLALSNIIRGFSFVPGNEKILSKHVGLLRLVGKLLRVYADDDNRQTNLFSGTKCVPTKFVGFAGVKREPETDDNSGVDELQEDAVAKQLLPYQNHPMVSDVAAMFLQKTTDQKPGCAPEEDSPGRLLLETANHLREDAFVVLAHISVQLDVFDIDSEVSWTLFDSLLHWAVSTNLQARDPLLPGIISPRNYALEILCKMSVIERNVDLMLSTGPWPRLEEFVRVLCSLISLGEEIPCREFAIVVLNAICAASEPACYVAAVETPVLNQLVSFLELADSNMHQFVQMQGMQALRENPEMMGTSVGMLRRATLIMVHIARHEGCRKYFVKLQNRLLQFTVSHFMDSRVAAMVADILFEMQKSESNNNDEKNTETESSNQQQPASPLRMDSAASSLQDDEASRLSTMMPKMLADELTHTIDNSLSIVPHLNGTSNSLSEGNNHSQYLKIETANARKRKSSSDYNSYATLADEDTHEFINYNGGPRGEEALKSIANQHSPSSCRKPFNTVVSDAVKEKIRNSIHMKHEQEHEDADTAVKRTKHVLNGVKLNGLVNAHPQSQNNNDSAALVHKGSSGAEEERSQPPLTESNNSNNQTSSVNKNSSGAAATEGSMTAVA